MSGSNDPNTVSDNDRTGYIGFKLYKSSSDIRYSDGIIDAAMWILYEGILFSLFDLGIVCEETRKIYIEILNN